MPHKEMNGLHIAHYTDKRISNSDNNDEMRLMIFMKGVWNEMSGISSTYAVPGKYG
jgi:hypothetical protein